MNSEKKEKEGNRLSEPASVYQVSSETESEVKIFSSFEELEDDNYRWLASLTPEQHLQNATELIKRIFAEDLKRHPQIGTELIFD